MNGRPEIIFMFLYCPVDLKPKEEWKEMSEKIKKTNTLCFRFTKARRRTNTRIEKLVISEHKQRYHERHTNNKFFNQKATYK